MLKVIQSVTDSMASVDDVVRTGEAAHWLGRKISRHADRLHKDAKQMP